MEYMDEKIIELMNEKQEELARISKENNGYEGTVRQDVQTDFIEINDEIIPFEEKSVLEDKVKLRLPETFIVMPPEIASLKYPSERRPNLIYTNESASINIAFNHTQSPLHDTNMEAFKKSMVQVIKKTQPLARWFEEGVRNVNGRNIGFCDFLAPALDVNIYNLLFFAELEGRALLCTFNCTEEEMKDWKPVAMGIMDSVKIVR